MLENVRVGFAQDEIVTRFLRVHCDDSKWFVRATGRFVPEQAAMSSAMFPGTISFNEYCFRFGRRYQIEHNRRRRNGISLSTVLSVNVTLSTVWDRSRCQYTGK